MRQLLVLNFALALFLTGLIWLVQVVQYPGFALVGKAEWAAFHRAHADRITPVVALPMLAELVLGAWLAWRGGLGAWGWAAYGLVLLTWAHTALVAVPLHNRLAVAPDPLLIAALIRTNWVRTLAWTARTALLGWLVWRRLG